MELSSLDVFRIGREKMRYLGERQEVLALNIANADTPDYKARDLKTPDFHAMVTSPMALGSVTLARTDKAHLEGTNTNSGHYRIITRKPSDERNPNDNRVAIDEEIQKVAHTQMDYNKVVGLYRKNINLFKMALGNNNA